MIFRKQPRGNSPEVEAQSVGEPGVERPVKPFRAVGVIAAVVIGLMVLIMTTNAVTGLFALRNRQAKAAAAGTTLPALPDPAGLAALAAQGESNVTDEQRALQAKELETKMLACRSVGGVPQQVSAKDINCIPPVPTSDSSIPPMTPAQQRAIAAGSGDGEVQTRREQREEARKKALDSDMLAIDFTQQATTTAPSAKPVSDKREQEDVAQKEPPAAADNDRQGEPSATGDKNSADRDELEAAAKGKKNNYYWDKFTGPLYRIFEGTILECVLTNRISGDFPSPVNVMLTTDVYSHNLQQVLIPRGTRILGTARRVTDNNQQRLAVTFQRAIMPDGWSTDLKQFTGLDQIGAAGLTGKVNHHYLALFGTSIALGAIAGFSQLGNSTSGYGYSPTVAIRNGISQRTGEEAEQLFSRALNRLPTIEIPEGQRVRVWVQQDIQEPAYGNHLVPEDL